MATNFLSNKALMAEIHASKRTYCEFLDGSKPSDFDYDLIMDEADPMPDDLADSTIIRVMTAEHIHPFDRGSVNFPPFIHVRMADGKPKMVVKSHHRKGQFSVEHGTLTRGLAIRNKYLLLPSGLTISPR